MSSIRKYLNPDEQLKLLENEKKLVFVDNESKKIFLEYLKLYGYYSLIKKTSHPFMYTKDENQPTAKIYNCEFTSNNLRYLFDIDRNISSIIYKYFRTIEFLINTSLSKVLAKKISDETSCPYIAAVSEHQFSKIFANLNDNMAFCKKKDTDLVTNVFNELFKNYRQDDISLEEIAKENKDRENQDILNKITKGWFYKNFKNNKQIKNIKHYHDWEYIDIYTLMEILSFQQLYRIYSYLSKSLKNEVMHQCICKIDKKNKLVAEDFELLIYILSRVRNLFSHNGFLLSFKYTCSNKNKLKSFNNINKYFDLQLDGDTLKLNHIVIIMEKLIGINKINKEIQDSIFNKLDKRTKRLDNVSKILFDIIEDFSAIKINEETKKRFI